MSPFSQKETKATKKTWHSKSRSVTRSIAPDLSRVPFQPSLSSFPSVKFFFLALTTLLSAEPGAKLIVPEPEAWTGQRLPLFVELRAEGSFKGAASFDLPEIPKTVIIKIGSPILSSETQGDTEYFVQRHEFALFSQSKGLIQLPSITARFSHLKGYTGPTFDASEKTEATTLTINRPPNSDSLGFIVTTPSLAIEESWDPSPGPLETGAVLKRNIVQRANQMTGIALKPAPTPDIEGIRTYPGSPEVTDKTERGTFLGERRETVTYLVQQAGLHTLPEIRIDWWNPSTQKLERQTLPSVTFTATAPPAPPARPSRKYLAWLIVPISLALLAFANRERIPIKARALYQRLDPPSNRAKRRFLSACHQNDPTTTRRRWEELRKFRPDADLSDQLRAEVTILLELEFGRSPSSQAWSGQALAEAYNMNFSELLKARTPSALPNLNP
jgi:hypothetical protein